jgi:hypothetical protein
MKPNTLAVTALIMLGCISAGRAAALPDTAIPGSFGVQLKNHNANNENLAKISATGIKVVRRGFIWREIEKQEGVYDFSAYDLLIDECEKNNLQLLGCLALENNKLYGLINTDRARQGYADFAAAAAKRYQNRNVIWEIWNEPNIASFWGKHGKANTEQFAAEYTALVKTAIPAMRAVNPDAVILAGSVSGVWEGPYKWMKFCFDKGILKTGLSGWSIHPYSTKNPEDYIAHYTAIRQMMADAGADENLPILDTERGYPLGKAEGYAGGDPALSEQYQAWHLVRQYMIELLCGIKLTNWYEWGGLPGNKEGFALCTADKETPAYTACRFILAHLKGYRFDQRIELPSDRDFVLRLTNANGGIKLVAWTSPPANATADQAKEHEVQIPMEESGEFPLCQLYGERDNVTMEAGKITLTLKPAPQYITILDK